MTTEPAAPGPEEGAGRDKRSELADGVAGNAAAGEVAHGEQAASARRADGNTTQPSLLEKVANLGDHPAWAEFVAFYTPLLELWCRRYHLDPNLSDELCHGIFIELMQKMPVYRYDPTGSFRGWLRRLFHHRALNLIKKRRSEVAILVDQAFLDRPGTDGVEFDSAPNDNVLALLREGERIHEAVRSRVKPWRWEAYWRIIIKGEDIRETGLALRMSYNSVYAASRYVDGMVRTEGAKLHKPYDPRSEITEGKIFRGGRET